MAKIEKLDLTAKLTARADELQKKLAKLTGDTSDDYERACAKADLLIERQRGGVLVPEGNPNDGRFRMVPDQSLRSTQQVNAVLAFKQKQLERAIRVAEGKLRAEADPAKKAELSNKLAQTKETLGEVVREKVT